MSYVCIYIYGDLLIYRASETSAHGYMWPQINNWALSYLHLDVFCGSSWQIVGWGATEKEIRCQRIQTGFLEGTAGLAWPGLAWPSLARPALARPGQIWPG